MQEPRNGGVQATREGLGVARDPSAAPLPGAGGGPGRVLRDPALSGTALCALAVPGAVPAGRGEGLVCVRHVPGVCVPVTEVHS